MKPLNLLLYCLVFISCVSACKKESEPEFGDFGLRKGECIAIAEYFNETKSTEVAYNSIDSSVVVTYIRPGIDPVVIYKKNENGFINKREYYDEGFLRNTVDYYYNSLNDATEIYGKNENGDTLIITSYQYNTDDCKLVKYCNSNGTCSTYNFFDENCSYEKYTNTTNTYYEYTVDGMRIPYENITVKNGYKFGNTVKKVTRYVSDSTINRITEHRNYEYNQYGYPTKYEVHISQPPDLEDFFFHSTTRYVYYCYE